MDAEGPRATRQVEALVQRHLGAGTQGDNEVYLSPLAYGTNIRQSDPHLVLSYN